MRKISVECPTANLDEYRRLAELACELGATHLSASQVELSMWQWNVNRHDPYPNWSLHRPTIFKFIVPEELKGYLPEDYAKRNLETLAKRVEILKEFGLKATFNGMEPAYLPEKVYRDHPAWRGPRCDQARRARTEYYAPCIDNPEVRDIYVRTIGELCKVAPFELFQLMTNDSGGGLCWNNRLYPGPNGPTKCRDISIGDRVVNFLSMFQEGAALAGLKAEVNTRNILPQDEPAVLPKLKEGQSINNRTLTTVSATDIVGFHNYYLDYSNPIARLSRMTQVSRQISDIQGKDNNLMLAFRDLDEIDTISFVKKYYRNMKPGIIGRYSALLDMAEEFVGKDHAETLVEAWDLIDDVYNRFSHLDTGGHIFVLGTVQQRWLTRPLVAFPWELKPEEKDYYREFQFQAQTEADADYLLDLQANRWLSGIGGFNLYRMTHDKTAPRLKRAIELMDSLIPCAADERAAKFLRGQAAKLKAWKCLMKNALNVISFQCYLDTADYSTPPKDTTYLIPLQGDDRFFRVNEIMRQEIDNTLELIEILENADQPILHQADSKEFENVMLLGPDLIDQLKKKISIMENHRRDILRLFKSYNK